MPWCEHCRWSKAHKILFEICWYFRLALLDACMFAQLAAHNSLQGVAGGWRGKIIILHSEFQIWPPFQFSFYLFVFLQIKGFLGVFAHLLTKCLNVPPDCVGFWGSSWRKDWRNVRFDRLMETKSWALSQQSDDGKVMVFFKNNINTMPYPWVVAKFVFCSVTQYCLLNKIHFTWFFFSF